MKRLYIIVEGQTEERFVKEILTPYFNEFGIWSIVPILIHTSHYGRGGFVNYQHLKNGITSLLHSSKDDFIVTTFVDYFRCPKLPGHEEYNKVKNHATRVELMEAGISSDIHDHRFLPYIQLHEFEALLFSSNKGFDLLFDSETSFKTNEIVNEYENPEEINSTPEGAPSKRILAINPSYNKVVDGVDIAATINLQTIMSRCPRFSSWIKHLIDICTIA